MKEFMTRLSDYISERKNDPEKNGSIFVFCMFGMVIFIIIILCLLLIWRKNTNEKNPNMTVETYEEKMETILAEGPGEEALQQQYLENTKYLEEKIEELLKSMAEIRETMETTVIAQEDGDDGLQIQIDEILGDINVLITQLQNTKNQLSELTDIVNVMNTETIPMIQEWIHEIEKQMEQVRTDISNIYEKIAALEITDRELKDKIKKIEGALKASIEQNMNDIENGFDNMNEQMGQIMELLEDAKTQINNLQSFIENVQNWINGMDGQLLLYQYDEDTNTLSLMPYRKEE